MNNLTRYILLAGAAAGTFAAFPSYAQDSESTGVEEVVVTARRVSEKLQDVPIAITAFSQAALEAKNVVSVQDLQNYVPSLTVSSANRDTVALSIRGQGGFSPGGSPSVTSYMNEVPTPIYGLGSYYDLESVEVLKGPQGTLFGQNSVGGALTLVSKRPTNNFGGHIEATLGNYNDKELEGALNIPIVEDKLLVRIAGEGEVRDGYTTLLGTVAQPNARFDLDNRQFSALRGTISFRPTDDIRNDFIADYYLSHTHGGSFILSAANPRGLLPSIFPGIISELAQQQSLGQRTEIKGIANDPNYKTLNQGFTDIFSYDITEELTFRNILGYRFTETSARTNTVGGIFPTLVVPYLTISPNLTKQYTEEPQIQGRSFDGKLTWVVGGYFQRNPTQPYNVQLYKAFGADTLSSTQTGEDSEAIYAQGTYDLSAFIDGLKFTGGYRYTWDYRSLSSGSLRNGACTTPGADAFCTLGGNASFHAPTWTVDFDYEVAQDTLVYITSRRGYRAGGFNNFAAVKSDQSFQSEYVTDLELGLKSTFDISGMKARTNVAAYRQWYDNVQVPSSIVQNGLPASVTLNAASAVLNGFEFEGTLIPTKGLELTATYAYGEAGFTNFDSPQAAAANKTFNWSNLPKHKITIGANYHLPVDSTVGDISLGFDFLWQDHFFNSVLHDPLQITGDVGLLNLQAQWQNVLGHPVDLSFFMTNATDRKYVLGGFEIYDSVGTSSVVWSEPRMFGFRLRYRFGAEAD